MLTSISFNLINRVEYHLCQSQKWQYHLCGDQLCARQPLGSKIRANRGPPVQKISLTQKVLLNWYFERKITFLGKFGFKMLLFQVFVKGRRDDFMAHPEEALHWGSEVFPSENDFQMMAKSYLRSGFFYKIVCLTRKFSDTFIKKKLSYYGSFLKIWRKNRFLKIQNSNTIP